MSLVPRIYINPYGQKQYRDSSSKSIFKEQNLHSNVIRALDVNQLTNIFENDSIIKGLELINTSITDNRIVNVSLSPGRIIQDNTLIDILEQVDVSLEVISIYDILNTNSTQNYIEISGDQTNNFKNGKQFAIQNSTISSFNHEYWIVESVELNNSTNNTIIYTSQNISEDDSTGQIVNDNFPNLNNGTILIMSKYQFQESFNNDQVEFVPLYTKTDSNYLNITSNCVPGFDENLYRILYCVIYINKNAYQIQSERYALTHRMNINIQGHNYFNRPTINQFNNFDGGEILIC